MASPFAGYETDEELRPVARLCDFDLGERLDAVVALEARISPDALSARTLGTERPGNAVAIGPDGLFLTIGYLITEADDVTLTLNDGRQAPAHPLAIDQATGFGLVQALTPVSLTPVPIGDSRKVRPEAAVIAVGGGGVEHALTAHIAVRQPFAGYWEYYLDEALFVEPAHPHWSGAALIGPTGELIGIGSLRMEQRERGGRVSSLNMFVPAELLPPIVDDMKAGRSRPPRPWLGVITQEIQGHVVVDGVSPGGPAERAELRRGDIVHRIAGHRVQGQAGFYKRLWSLGPPGVSVALTLQREHDVFDVEIRSVDRTAMQRKRRLN